MTPMRRLVSSSTQCEALMRWVRRSTPTLVEFLWTILDSKGSIKRVRSWAKYYKCTHVEMRRGRTTQQKLVRSTRFGGPSDGSTTYPPSWRESCSAVCWKEIQV